MPYYCGPFNGPYSTIVQANKADSDSEDEAETKRQNSAAKLNLQATAFQAIGLAWPDSTHTQGSFQDYILTICIMYCIIYSHFTPLPCITCS